MRNAPAISAGIITLSLATASSVIGQGLTPKGQLWTSLTLGDDPALSRSNIEQTVGYIPSLSWSYSLGALRSVDVEAAYRWSALIDGALGRGEGGSESSGSLYRLWGRFATESLDLRLGIQKIAFGPARVLRPLMWFDTFDIKDPTGQTEGVEAFRLRWFPHPELTAWLWMIRPDHLGEAMLGGRLDFTGTHGNLAVTFHHRENDNDLEYAGGKLVPYDRGEYRLAMDARWDGFVGLWTEAVFAGGTEPAVTNNLHSATLMMIGGDYTLPWWNGIYLMLEHLWSSSDFVDITPDTDIVTSSRREKHLTVMMASVPWGFFDSLMALASYDWENERLSNFLMWQRSYDNISLNLILYANPRRSDYPPEYQLGLPKTLAGFGNGIQIMIVFNH